MAAIKSYGLFIDLTHATSVEEAIKALQINDEKSLKEVANKARAKKPTYEVGIKQKDGTIVTENFSQFRNRCFLKPVE